MQCLDNQFHCLEAKLPQDPLDQSVVCHIYRSCPDLASTSIFPYILDIHSVYLSITFYPPLAFILSICLSHSIHFCAFHFLSISHFICILYICPPHSIHLHTFRVHFLHLSNILYINSIHLYIFFLCTFCTFILLICLTHSLHLPMYSTYLFYISPLHSFIFMHSLCIQLFFLFIHSMNLSIKFYQSLWTFYTFIIYICSSL